MALPGWACERLGPAFACCATNLGVGWLPEGMLWTMDQRQANHTPDQLHDADGVVEPESSGSWYVQIDIACPVCEYNLRGLPGPIATCPECGRVCNVPELASRQWDKPWYTVPGFKLLFMAIAVLILWGCRWFER